MSTTSNTQTYDKNSDNFAVSPSLTLGHLYQQYQEELYLRAVATPSDYAKVRSNVIQKVKMGIVNDLYKNLRSVLCKGEILSSGEKLISFSSGGSYSAASYCPNYPPPRSRFDRPFDRQGFR